MGQCLEARYLEKLHRAGIAKSTEHVFVYRYPDSDKMPAMDSKEFARDLKRSGERQRELAFYVHIPFCTKICGYCHYFKQPFGGKKQADSYLHGIEKEVLAYRKLLEAGVGVNSVLFGGGTPTCLKAGQLNGLMAFLRELFPMPRKTEATVESSPETLSLEKLAVLRQNFNRLSIGVQDFDDRVLKACNRNHSKRQAVQAVKDARDAGFANVNIDLIYGLPLQGIEGWRKTLEEVEGIQPESVTASDLRVRQGSAFFALGKEKFASEAELIAMHSMFIEKMASLGYRQLFPYQFVKKGREMRFLLNQWSNNEFLGFGASSCSYLNGWDYNNVFPTREYLEMIGETGLACCVGKKLSLEEQMVRHVRLGLKNCLFGGVDKKQFRKRFGKGLEEAFGERVRELELLGLVENSKNALGLSRKGILFYDSVARKFFGKALG